MTTIAQKAKEELKRLLLAGIPQEMAEAVIARSVIKWAEEEKREEATWIEVLREHMAELVIELYGAGLDHEISITIAAQGERFEIKRGNDKGESRSWKFSQNRGTTRPRLSPGERLSRLFKE